MELSERTKNVLKKWVTQPGNTDIIVIGLCRECHRTYGHDDDCRTGTIIQLQSSLAEARKAAHWADDMRKNYKEQLNSALEEIERLKKELSVASWDVT